MALTLHHKALVFKRRFQSIFRNTAAVRLGEIGAVFLGFGFVLAQSQGFANLLLRQSLAKTQKSSLRTAALFLQTLWRREQPVKNYLCPSRRFCG